MSLTPGYRNSTATVTGNQLDGGGGKMTPLNGVFQWPI